MMVTEQAVMAKIRAVQREIREKRVAVLSQKRQLIETALMNVQDKLASIAAPSFTITAGGFPSVSFVGAAAGGKATPEETIKFLESPDAKDRLGSVFGFPPELMQTFIDAQLDIAKLTGAEVVTVAPTDQGKPTTVSYETTEDLLAGPVTILDIIQRARTPKRIPLGELPPDLRKFAQDYYAQVGPGLNEVGNVSVQFSESEIDRMIAAANEYSALSGMALKAGVRKPVRTNTAMLGSILKNYGRAAEIKMNIGGDPTTYEYTSAGVTFRTSRPPANEEEREAKRRANIADIAARGGYSEAKKKDLRAKGLLD